MRFIASREVAAVQLTGSENFNASMRCNFYELIWCRFDIDLINTTEI